MLVSWKKGEEEHWQFQLHSAGILPDFFFFLTQNQGAGILIPSWVHFFLKAADAK